jgi:hypothetical protein
MRPVSGLVTMSLNPSLQMKLTDGYAAGNTDPEKSRVDERYRLVTSTIAFVRLTLPQTAVTGITEKPALWCETLK